MRRVGLGSCSLVRHERFLPGLFGGQIATTTLLSYAEIRLCGTLEEIGADSSRRCESFDREPPSELPVAFSNVEGGKCVEALGQG